MQPLPTCKAAGQPSTQGAGRERGLAERGGADKRRHGAGPAERRAGLAEGSGPGLEGAGPENKVGQAEAGRTRKEWGQQPSGERVGCAGWGRGLGDLGAGL